MIRAECHSDDMAETARLDATPFFETAGDDAILALAECGWGGDYPADDVARELADRPGYEMVADVVERPGVGFECNVHEPDALAWLRDNKPALHARVCESLELDPATPFGDERAPHWDSDASWRGGYAVATGPAPGSR